ncbi:hypothetical protein [Aureibaculum luteum]|uniref:hypothetical protein n=1 Tax=Aureibaculum luteum TaxID=1548456 RepID=UPI001300914B|nr:hypothetical protein [Aureibaculum luteum]
MTKFSTYFLLLISFSLLGCNSQSGYSDLDELYSDFVVFLKDADENNLKAYCNKITPDQGTVDYMKNNNFSYRGIPEELEKQNIKPSLIGEEFFKSVAYFKQKLIRNNQLENLIYIGREQEGEELYNEKLKIYVTETFIIMESNGKKIKCKLGEMFRIDGKWKSFTSPKLGW